MIKLQNMLLLKKRIKMNSLLLLKTQKNIYLSLLGDGNIIEAIKCFEKYQKQLLTYSEADVETQAVILKELNSSRNVFIRKLTTLGNVCINKQEYNKAAICLSEVLQYRYKDFDCLIKYIICLYNLKHFDLLEEFLDYLKTLITDDINPVILKYISKMYVIIDNLEQAIVYMNRYISYIDEDKIEYEDYDLLGTYYSELYTKKISNPKYKDLQYILDSMDCFLKADELNPTSKSVTNSIALTAPHINNLKLSKIYWEKLFHICKMTEDDLTQYSYFCLKNKDFENFNKYYNFRIFSEKNSLPLRKGIKNKKMWYGEDLSDKTLLILYEQGFGDNFLAYGYMPRLAKIAKKVIFLVQDSVYPLLKDNEYGIEILKLSSTNVNKLEFDFYTPSMSIISALSLDESNISVGGGYIKADKNLTKIFKDKYFNNDKFKIGLSYKGNTNNCSLIRNIPIEEFEPLCKLKDTECYLLTVDITDGERKFCEDNNIIVLEKDLHNFAQTAAAIENLDIIVSTDNVILNLAGAMGKKTLGLFNWYYEYRWYDLTGEDVGWYTSVKPFVNPSINDWQTSVTKVVEEIEKHRNN